MTIKIYEALIIKYYLMIMGCVQERRKKNFQGEPTEKDRKIAKKIRRIALLSLF